MFVRERHGQIMLNGLYALDPGQLASLVTYLRHDLAALPPRPPGPEGAVLRRLGADDLATYRQLFRTIGGDWLWFSRLRMTDSELASILADPDVCAQVLAGPTGDVGLLELDFRDATAPELAFCGVLPTMVGSGLGRAMIGEALHLARERGAASLHVHTCSLDHPRALTFYEKAGFKPYRRAIEVFADPRLDGTLPRDVARQIPLLDGVPD